MPQNFKTLPPYSKAGLPILTDSRQLFLSLIPFRFSLRTPEPAPLHEPSANKGYGKHAALNSNNRYN